MRSLALVLGAVLFTACQDEDPLAERLAVRSQYTADVVAFRPRDDGGLLVELEVRAALAPVLKALTVTVRQHDVDSNVLRQDRVTVDISAMDATGTMQLYATVAESAEAMDALSATVEHDPPVAEYDEFPELKEVSR